MPLLVSVHSPPTSAFRLCYLARFVSFGLPRSVCLPLFCRSVSRSWRSVSISRSALRSFSWSVSGGLSRGMCIGLSLLVVLLVRLLVVLLSLVCLSWSFSWSASLGLPLGLSPFSCGLRFAICALVALGLGQSLGLSLAVFWSLSLSVSHLSRYV